MGLIAAGAAWLLYDWVWPQRSDGKRLNLAEALDDYEQNSHHYTDLRRIVFMVAAFIAWVLALLVRKRYK